MSRGLAAPGMPGRAAALPPRAADAAGDAVAISKQPPRSFAQYISASAWRTRSSRTEFFSSSSRRHTMFSRDWSSDVCSSDLEQGGDEKCLRHQESGIENEIGVDGGAGSRYNGYAVPRWKQALRKVIGQPRQEYAAENGRSEERRVGTDCGRTGLGSLGRTAAC